jgi:hypothetical protein
MIVELRLPTLLGVSFAGFAILACGPKVAKRDFDGSAKIAIFVPKHLHGSQ